MLKLTYELSFVCVKWQDRDVALRGSHCAAMASCKLALRLVVTRDALLHFLDCFVLVWHLASPGGFTLRVVIGHFVSYCMLCLSSTVFASLTGATLYNMIDLMIECAFYNIVIGTHWFGCEIPRAALFWLQSDSTHIRRTWKYDVGNDASQVAVVCYA